MNAIRSIVFMIWMYGLIVLLGLVCLPLLFGPPEWVKKPLDMWMAMVFWGVRHILHIHIHIEGRKNIPDGPYMLASKHQSMLDVLLPWIVFPFPAIILKKQLAWLPFFGWYALRLQNIAVDRKAGARALRKMQRKAKVLAMQGRQLLIFPEGTRVPVGETGKYKPGVAGLYLQLGVPCVPIALNTGTCWPAHGIVRTPGHVTMQILPPIAPGLERKAFMQELQDRIETASKALLEAPQP